MSTTKPVSLFQQRGRFLPVFCLAGLLASDLFAQTPSSDYSEGETGRLTFQKTVITRPYGGKEVEGEERAIGTGDSLWRILIQERGLSQRRFSRYLTLMHALNPQLKSPDLLNVGDSLFVPLHPDQVLGFESAAEKRAPSPLPSATARGESVERGPAGFAPTREYRVEVGDTLYLIMRRELRIVSERELAAYFALVKDLNPGRKNWDLLREGEILRLPAMGETATKIVKEIKLSHPIPPGEDRARVFEKMETPPVTASSALVDIDARRLQARDHMALLARVIESLGNEVQRSGQQVLPVREGTIRIDKSSYPVIHNPKLEQKIIFDPDNRFPPSLRKQLEESSLAITVVSLKPGESLHDGVGRLLSHLGYQLLPSERPVGLQVGGIGFAARGNWVALAPEENNKPQEIYVINLTGQLEEIPDYLKAELSLKGLHMKDIRVPGVSATAVVRVRRPSNHSIPEVKHWPRDDKELIDTVLASYGIAYGVADTLSIELRDGLRLDVRSDRTFETAGRRTALFFQRLEPEIKRTLQEKNDVKSVELELATASRKEIIARLLAEIGDAVHYREHRFSASDGEGRDHLNLTAPGFLLQSRGLFLTDREVPRFVQRFLFEKGLAIVYFH